MNRILALIMLVVAFPASALDFEIGTGVSHYKIAHDGLWYQASYPHTFDLKDRIFSLGVSGESNGIRYRAEYLSLGWMYSSAQFVGDDHYYPGTAEPATVRGVGRGSVAGLALTASRGTPLFGIPFYAEAGPYIYIPKWQVSIFEMGTDRHLGEIAGQSNPRVGVILGVGVRYSGIDVGIKYVGLQNHGGDQFKPIYDHAYVLETKVYF